MAHASSAHAAHPQQAPRRERRAVPRWAWLAVPALAVLLVWPVQSIAVALLILDALLLTSMATMLQEQGRLRVGPRVRAQAVNGLIVVIGSIAVLVLVWPTAVATGAFFLTVATCLAWLALEQHRSVEPEGPHAPPPTSAVDAAPRATAAPAPSGADVLAGKQVAFLVANEGVEESELIAPWKAIADAGGVPILVAPNADEPVRSMRGLDHGLDFAADLAAGDASAEEFDGLVLPGGVANPDELRMDESALALVRSFGRRRVPIGAICHGAWTLVDAGIVAGHTLTSWPSLRTDLENAGARWVDRPVVVDDNLITSRKPDDLPEFCAALVRELAAAPVGAR
jgi:protease I